MSKLVAILLLLSACSSSMNCAVIISDDQIIFLVNRICTKSMTCPYKEYASIQPRDWVWNRDAVLTAPSVQLYKAGKVPKMQVFDLFQEQFCCASEECLARCNIVEIREKPLVQFVLENFPKNAPKILSLELEELKDFEKPIRNYINDLKHNKDLKFVPAEVEDFLDYLDRNNDRIIEKMNNSQ